MSLADILALKALKSTKIVKSQNVLNPSDIQWFAQVNVSGGIQSSTIGKTGVFTFKPKLNTRYYFTRKTSGGAYTTWDSRVAFCDSSGNVLSVVSSGVGTYDITVTDPNVASIRKFCSTYNNNDAITATINGGMLIEGWDGTTPVSFIPYSTKLNQPTPLTIATKQSDLYDDRGVQLFDWFGKNESSYGDSISALTNAYIGDYVGSANNNCWGAYVHSYFKMSSFYGRGIGSSQFAWNTQTWYANADGSYADRPPNAQPANTTIHKGSFCSWDRIKTMYSDTIRNSIDLILVMGGTNDFGNNIPLGSDPVWSASNTTDTDWSSDVTFYNGGDYDISTFKGGIASTVMKLQARCPNAIIVLMSQMSGEGGVIQNPQTNTLSLRPIDYVNALIQASQFMSIPYIDVFGGTGINNFNATTNILSDGIHPSTIGGAKALARPVIGGLKRILPNL